MSVRQCFLSPVSFHRYRRQVAVFIMVSFIAPAGWGESGYALSQALADALARDARLRSAEARVSEVAEEREKALGLRRPTFRATGGYGYSYDESQSRFVSTYEGSSTRLGVDVVQKLWSFGRIPAHLRNAEAQIDHYKAQVKETRALIMSEVAQAFVEHLHRQDIVDKRRIFENQTDEWERLVKDRLDAGQATLVELQDVRIRLHQARAERLRAQAEARVTRTRLVALTGNGDWKMLNAGALSALWAMLPTDVAAAEAAALAQAPRLEIAETLLRQAKAGFDIAEAALRPDLDLELGWSTDDTANLENDSIEAFVNFNVPLYEGGALRANRRQAAHSLTAAWSDVFAAEDDIKREVRLNWRYLDGLSKAERNLAAAVSNTEERVDLVDRRIAAGRATLLDKLEAELALVNVRVDLVENAILIDNTRVTLLRELNLLSP